MSKSLVTRVVDFLRLPESPRTTEEANSANRFATHAEVLARRRQFYLLANDIQQEVLRLIESDCRATVSGRILEIGCGTIALERLDPRAISTDITMAEGISCVLSADQIPFAASTFRAVVAQNALHHLPDFEASIDEISRVLEPGGLIVIIEPFHGGFARRVFPYLFSFEGYDLTAQLGTTCKDNHGNSIPNQAASYVIFEQNAEYFSARFPSLRKVKTSPMPSGVRYILTGGLNFRQLAPSGVLLILRRIERMTLGQKLLRRLALHWMVVLQLNDASGEAGSNG